MDKATIFLSHIGEERDLASLIKAQIEDSFLGLVDIFVSSDSHSIPLGQNWLDRVTHGLRSCKAMLLLCSPASIGRPWINFEAGAAWARNIEVAPICHSGLRPVDLPLPMSLLQGLEANDPTKLDQVFQLIARQIGASTPTIDTGELANKVRAFEAPYTLRMRFLSDAKTLKSLNGAIVGNILLNNPGVTVVFSNIPERDFILIRPYLDNLQQAGGLQHSYSVTGMAFGGSGGGSFGTLAIQARPELYELLKQL